MKKMLKKQQGLLAGKRRTIDANKSLGLSLAFIAGAINAGGFMVVNQYTSHMTGIISLAADSLALGNWLSSAAMLLYIMCFILGAAMTAILVMWARKNNLHSQYALPLTMEALLLIIFGLVNIRYVPNTDLSYVIALLCYLMGLQNAVITKISGAAIRTTHITGMATDIGIEIGKIIYSGNNNRQYTKPNKDKIWLHLSLVSMFLLGGVSGAFVFKYIGFLSVMPLAGYLLFLSFVPIKRDITVKKYMLRRMRRASSS